MLKIPISEGIFIYILEAPFIVVWASAAEKLVMSIYCGQSIVVIYNLFIYIYLKYSK